MLIRLRFNLKWAFPPSPRTAEWSRRKLQCYQRNEASQSTRRRKEKRKMLLRSYSLSRQRRKEKRKSIWNCYQGDTSIRVFSRMSYVEWLAYIIHGSRPTTTATAEEEKSIDCRLWPLKPFPWLRISSALGEWLLIEFPPERISLRASRRGMRMKSEAEKWFNLRGQRKGWKTRKSHFVCIYGKLQFPHLSLSSCFHIVRNSPLNPHPFDYDLWTLNYFVFYYHHRLADGMRENQFPPFGLKDENWGSFEKPSGEKLKINFLNPRER